jgi:hypothetical protein
MSKLKSKIVYAGGKTVVVTDTLEGIVEMMLTNETLKKYTPLKVYFPDAPGGLVLCYNQNLFAGFHDGGVHYSELIEATQCDDVYRNTIDLNVHGMTVDSGALWMARGSELILIDDDMHLTYPLTKLAFEIAQ